VENICFFIDVTSQQRKSVGNTNFATGTLSPCHLTHLGVAERSGLLPEGNVGGNDDAGLLMELADQVEQQLTARSGERQIDERASM